MVLDGFVPFLTKNDDLGWQISGLGSTPRLASTNRMISSVAMKLVGTLREEAAMHALDKLITYLDAADVPYMDDIRDVIGGFRDVLKADMKEEQKAATKKPAASKADPSAKRAPSAYNQFMSWEMARLKESNPNMDGKERREAANRLWHERKEAAAGPSAGAGASSSSESESGKKKKAAKKVKPAEPVVVHDEDDDE